MENTAIEWATHTFNAWEGCSKVSPGCANCYAEERANRFGSSKWGPQGTRVVRSESFWRQPLKWNAEAGWCGNPYCLTPERKAGIRPGKCSCGLDVTRPRVFCNSLSDVFEDWQGGKDGDGSMTCYRTGEELSINAAGHVWPMGHPSMSDGDDWGARPYTMADVRARLFKLIDATPNLDWLIVTKRPENINRFTPARDVWPREDADTTGANPEWLFWRDNVWHLASVEDQPTADRRIPELLKVRSACLGLSMEPLLESVQLRQNFADGSYRDYLTGQFHNMKATGENGHADFVFSTTDPSLPKLGWIIAGGESGQKARPSSIDALFGVVRQCKKAGTPVFVKQLGAHPFAARGGTRFSMPCPQAIIEKPDRLELKLIDKKGGNPAEWPEELRVRESPRPLNYHRQTVGA